MSFVSAKNQSNILAECRRVGKSCPGAGELLQALGNQQTFFLQNSRQNAGVAQMRRVKRYFLASHASLSLQVASAGHFPRSSGFSSHATNARLIHAVWPNQSLKRSANGMPPGPGLRYSVHFLSPGPGVIPSSPA